MGSGALADAPMRLVSERVIDDEVRRGLDKNSPRMQEIIRRRVPTFLQGVVRNEAGVQGGKLYNGVQNGCSLTGCTALQRIEVMIT
jgi:hypothetical protein